MVTKIRYKPVKKENIKCIICGDLFKGFTKNRYCSNHCYKLANLKRANLKHKLSNLRFIPKELECKNCHKIFIQNNNCHKKWCSSLCAKRYYKEHWKEKVRSNPNSIYNRLLKLRFEIFKRDEFQCQYCGRSPKIDKCKLIIEHIIPRIKGGKSEPGNLTTSCIECNQGKSDVLLEIREFNKEVKNEAKMF